MLIGSLDLGDEHECCLLLLNGEKGFMHLTHIFGINGIVVVVVVVAEWYLFFSFVQCFGDS